MKIIQGIEAVAPPFPQSVLSIGNFDGVHRAHQQLLAQAGLFAANTGGPVVVLTFEPHPLVVVRPEKAPPRLSPAQEKLRYLAEAGADVVVVARSDHALLDLEAEAFIHEVIRERFNPTHIVEGPSFGFGKGRKGNPELLRDVAAGFGCEVHIVDPVTLQVTEGETLLVSSSLIRGLIIQGKVHRAALCLGRPYTLVGTVGEGVRRGRTIGFPTANLEVEDQLIPADGVYAGRSIVRDTLHLSAISIGSAPTFGEGDRQVEAYLLDFDGDLYGEPLRLEFDRLLRPQRTYDSPEALIDQIRRDVQAVRRLLGTGVPDTPSAEAQA
ncbi:MAG: bifunctional riboflavin kinase/FAD synthetase [Phycisphaerales bacterium]|nr:MAG: bifunctional riboflavin kinase/FAD synthetase [Phycisphaerales bacterium]